jgi:hypothetical protein
MKAGALTGGSDARARQILEAAQALQKCVDALPFQGSTCLPRCGNLAVAAPGERRESKLNQGKGSYLAETLPEAVQVREHGEPTFQKKR